MVTRLAIAIALLAIPVVALAGPPVIAQDARRFDHAKHVQVLAESGKPAVVCAACHRTNPDDGKPSAGREHDRCTTCHALDRAKQSCDLVKVPGPKSPARQCAVCHVATRAECLPNDLPALPKQPSFTARFAHNRHAGLGDSMEKDCRLCHRAEAGAGNGKPNSSEGHAACSGCHNGRGSQIAMNQCESCHVAPKAALLPAPDPFALHAFDHTKHRDHANTTACLSCHKAIANAPVDAVPTPSMLGCQQTCHDGKKAFSATGTSCTKCHSGSEPPAKQRLDLPFSHATHKNRGVGVADCAQCHTSEADGTLLVPGFKKDHQPCANSGCHQTEFASKTTKICGACHDAQAPWAHAIARARKIDKSEWFQPINHKIHTAIAGTTNEACTTCHGDRFAGAPAPIGHKGCAVGGKCHGGPEAPSITDCRLCHKAQAPAQPARSAWSVAATFKHATHASDPRTHATSRCVECHANAPAATELGAITAPVMKSCEGCHNGKAAFKTTGFECVRCHTKGAAATTLSMMETRP